MARSASRVSTPAGGVLRQEIDLTPPLPPRADSLNPETPLSFWEEVAAVSENDWATEEEKGYKSYLYEGPQGSGNFLRKITHPFDIEWVKETFGGGYYRATLNDPGGKIVASIRFSIDGESKRKPPQNATAPAAPPSVDHFPSQVLQILERQSQRTEALLQQLIERDRAPVPAAAMPVVDPNIVLRGVVDMFTGVLSKAQGPQMNILEMFTLMEKMRGPDLLQVLTQAKAAGLIPASSGNGDLMSQLTALSAVAEKLGWQQGGGRTIGEVLVEKLPEIADGAGKLLDRYHSLEQTRLATAQTVRDIQMRGGGQVLPPQSNPAPLPAGARPAATMNAPAPTAGVGLEVEPVTQGQVVAEMSEQELNAVKMDVVRAVAQGAERR